LRAARETAGLSLDQAAQQLKLAPRQVRALEDEDFEHLPGRTFTRGFVRNYARLLNLDPEDLLALMPDASNAPSLEAPVLHSTGVRIAELPSVENGTPGFGRWLIPLVLVACVVAAAAYEWYRTSLAPPVESARSVPQATDAATSAVPAPGTTSLPLPNPVAAQGSEPVKPEPEAVAQESQPVPAPTAAVAPELVAVAAPASPAPATPAPLLLAYTGPSWTEIRDRDGQLLISRLVPAGSEQAIRGGAPFDVVIGNAAAVKLVYRGREIDLARYTRQNVARLRLP
jgi:cytoskeleton protein RodZ